MVVTKKVWHRVKAPLSWRPKAGEEIIGTYLATMIRSGQFGEYKVHHIKTRARIYYVSGTVINDLFALIPVGTKVKLVFNGMKMAQNTERKYKSYELYTEEAMEFKIVHTEAG